MEGDPGYALQKLDLAIDGLAIGPRDVRDRLGAVFVSHLHVLTEDDFPEHLRPAWIDIVSMLTKKPPFLDAKGEILRSSVDRTLERMRNATGSKIAKKIVALRDRLRAHLEDLQ